MMMKNSDDDDDDDDDDHDDDDDDDDGDIAYDAGTVSQVWTVPVCTSSLKSEVMENNYASIEQFHYANSLQLDDTDPGTHV